ncbi:MAG: metalloprotease TldD [Parvibaculaceae bacterium]
MRGFIVSDLFFRNSDLDPTRAEAILEDALQGCDDGELFLEASEAEVLVFDDGKLKSASFDTSQGFGLRAVSGSTTAYAHAGEVSERALRRAAETVKAVRSGRGGAVMSDPPGTNRSLYAPDNPIAAMPFEEKVRLLEEADAFARGLDPKVRQVSISLAGQWQAVEILRAGGFRRSDRRPLVRFNVSVVSGDGDRQESGTYGIGGRDAYGAFLSGEGWRDVVREALRQSLIALEAVPAPAGEMDVVLGPGWPGILLHEAIGHGLEGDFHRKKTSTFSGMVGQRIASKGVTIVDDGTIDRRRGSLSIDDEGTPTNSTTLIEDGILVGLMQDRLNARLMSVKPTGNGRRQSYAHQPMPRMTNTYMLAGDRDPAEILASVKNGLYAVSFGGGQVDITSGKFVFSCTEAYRIENGRIGAPVKGATIIGNGADALTRISMVGNDMKLDSGMGTCGKQGQGVPVGVGQPTLRLDRITVGGTGA